MGFDQQAGPAIVAEAGQKRKAGFAVARADLQDEDLPLMAVMDCVQEHDEDRRIQLVRASWKEGSEVTDHGRTPEKNASARAVSLAPI